MPSTSRTALAAVLALAAFTGPAICQWVVTPPTPPNEWRQFEIPLPRPRDPASAGQASPGAPNDSNDENGNTVQQPNAACPYQERKLDLLV